MSASGSNHLFGIQEESVAGVLPSPFNPVTQRILEGSDINDQRSSLVSSELTGPSRQILSSTLGAQKPDVSFGVEYSFDSFDLLLESTFQNRWAGAGLATAVTVDVAAAALTTNGGELWSTYGFANGDIITVTGFTAASDDGSLLITSGSGTDTLVVTTLGGASPILTAAVDNVLTVIGGRLATVVGTNSITVNATAKTLTAASALWTESTIDLRYNDLIYLNGFTNAANNGYFKVVSATSTVLTLHADSVLAAEVIASGVEVTNNTGILTVSNNPLTFSILSAYTDIGQYRTSSGNQVGSASWSFAVDSLVSGDFSIMGLSVTDYGVVDPSSTTVASTTTPVFNTFRGFISFNGSAPACLTSLDISLDNGSEGLQCLFTKALSDITSGKANCTGSFSAYFDDAQLANLYANETAVNIFTVMEDADGASMGFGIPNAQLQSDSNQINESTVEESIDFQALGGDALTNLYIIKSRAIPA